MRRFRVSVWLVALAAPVLTLAPNEGTAKAVDPVAAGAPQEAVERKEEPAPSCGELVALISATYADVPSRMELPEGSVPKGAPTCFVCPAGSFCALGTRKPGTRVGVKIESRLVAVGELPLKTCSAQQEAAPVTSTAPQADVSLCAGEGGESREPWFVVVPSIDVPTRSVVTAEALPVATQVLRHGTPPRRSSFEIDAAAVARPGSSLGAIGTGVGIASMTRGVRGTNILEPPHEDDVSPWAFGLRYDAALFSQDWLHRLSVIAEYDIVRQPKWSLTPGALLGVGASFENGSNSTILAGLLAGISLHIDWQVAWQIAAVFGVTGQGVFINGNAMWIASAYAGPRVGF